MLFSKKACFKFLLFSFLFLFGKNLKIPTLEICILKFDNLIIINNSDWTKWSQFKLVVYFAIFSVGYIGVKCI